MIKKISKRFLHFHLLRIFICCCLFLVISPLFSAEKNPDQKLQLIKKELIQINADLKKTTQEKNQQIKKIKAFDVEIASLRKKLGKFKIERRSTKKEIEQLKLKSSRLTISLKKNINTLAKMTRALYEMGDENYLKIILNHSNAGEQDRMRFYYEYFYKTFEKQQITLKDNINELVLINDALTQKLSEYDILLKKLKKETESLKNERKSKRIYLAKLNQKIKSKKSRIKLLKSSRKTLAKILKALKKRKHREAEAKLSGMSFAENKGRLKWPVKGKIRRKFGQIRSNTGLRWRGVLISAKLGAKVSAVENGTVVFSDWLSGYGFVLIIDHRKGYLSLYGHNQQLLKSVGDKVKAGDIIAESGNSGRLGESGLYFEIRRNGKPVNPAKWMMARKRR